MRYLLSKQTKSTKLSLGGLFLCVGVLLNLLVNKYAGNFDKEIVGFLTGLLFGGGLILIITAFLGKRKD